MALSQGFSLFAVPENVISLGSPTHLPLAWAKNDLQTLWTTTDNCRTDYYLAPALTLADDQHFLWTLTGPPARLPDYALGLLASHSGWNDSASMAALAASMRTVNVPVDAIVADYEWFTPETDQGLNASGSPAFADFNFSQAVFPEPATDIAVLHEQANVRFGGLRWPRLGNSDVLEDAASKDCLLEEPPALAPRLLNLTAQTCRDWYADHLAAYATAGVDFFWNVDGTTSYLTYLLLAQAEAEAGERLSHRLARAKLPDHLPASVSHQQQGPVQATPNTAVAAGAGSRPFGLARSHVPGTQAYGMAVTSGQLTSSWQMLARSTTHMLRYALAGSPYYAGQVGGSNGDLDETLLVRWYQAAVFFPIMRVHTPRTGASRFPSSFTGVTLQRLRAAVQLRYRLLPLFRSLARDLADAGRSLPAGGPVSRPATTSRYVTARAAEEKGLPPVRPMLMAFPSDKRFATEASQWMLGDDLFVAPQITSALSRDIAVPAGRWFSFNTSYVTEGPAQLTVSPQLDEIYLFARVGSIIPIGQPVLATGAAPGAPLLIHIYCGANASFVLTEDDGTSMAAGSADARTTTFVWDDDDQALLWNVSGSYSGDNAYALVQAVAFFEDTSPMYSQIRDIGSGGYFSFAAAAPRSAAHRSGADSNAAKTSPPAYQVADDWA